MCSGRQIRTGLEKVLGKAGESLCLRVRAGVRRRGRAARQGSRWGEAAASLRRGERDIPKGLVGWGEEGLFIWGGL